MKYKILILLCVLSIFIASCQKEVVDNSANIIAVTAQNASDATISSEDGTLKTTFATPLPNWASGDAIGLYSDRAITTGPGVFANNISFSTTSTSSNGSFTSATTVSYDGTTNVHHFYAYYPQAGTQGPTGPGLGVVPIALSATQTQTGTTTTHLAALDRMIATPLSLTPVSGGPNPAVNFTFNHAFAILKFNITSTQTPTLTSIVLNSTNSPVSLNATTLSLNQAPPAGSPGNYTYASGGTGTNSITLSCNQALSGTVSSFYMVILPGAHATTAPTITLNSATKSFSVPAKPTVTFQRGVVYTITIAVGNGKL